MKKIGLVLILMLAMIAGSACSLNVSVETNGKSEKAPEQVKVVEEIPGNKTAGAKPTNEYETDAFYGVWCSGSKNMADAEKFARELSQKGFEARVFVTTDWENLNPEKFYVVTAGVCKTKQEAETLLAIVKESGYKDAYVKYSGSRK